MQKKLTQKIGWVGVVAILLAYSLLNFGILSSSNPTYLGLNFIGAIAIAYEAWSKRDQQPMVLNIIWAVIALLALIRLWMA